jgi:hypothetical protein
MRHLTYLSPFQQKQRKTQGKHEPYALPLNIARMMFTNPLKVWSCLFTITAHTPTPSPLLPPLTSYIAALTARQFSWQAGVILSALSRIMVRSP